MSIGVIIAAVVIYINPEWKIADPICTYVFSIIVCFTVTKVIKSCVMVLMESAPVSLNSNRLISEIKNHPKVVKIHDFHCW